MRLSYVSCFVTPVVIAASALLGGCGAADSAQTGGDQNITGNKNPSAPAGSPCDLKEGTGGFAGATPQTDSPTWDGKDGVSVCGKAAYCEWTGNLQFKILPTNLRAYPGTCEPIQKIYDAAVVYAKAHGVNVGGHAADVMAHSQGTGISSAPPIGYYTVAFYKTAPTQASLDKHELILAGPAFAAFVNVDADGKAASLGTSYTDDAVRLIRIDAL